jgi:hypothetical protein
LLATVTSRAATWHGTLTHPAEVERRGSRPNRPYSTSLVHAGGEVAGKKYVMAMHISLFAAETPTVVVVGRSFM